MTQHIWMNIHIDSVTYTPQITSIIQSSSKFNLHLSFCNLYSVGSHRKKEREREKERKREREREREIREKKRERKREITEIKR